MRTHKGFDNYHEGQSCCTSLAEVVRICDRRQPDVIFCEDLSGLIPHDRGRAFETTCDAFGGIGYDVFAQVPSSEDAVTGGFGRNRVGVVCFRKGIIKSLPGQSPTLYNADANSQLLYEMVGMDDGLATRFNRLVDDRGRRDWSRCVDMFGQNGVEARFIGCRSEALEDNLLFVRESMPHVLAWIFREQLLVDPGTRTLGALCRKMASENPLGYRMPSLYEKVIKDFLFASFSGMTGSRPWDGVEANGSHVVVLPDGEVRCHHASKREQLRDYLLRNTSVERVDCEKFKWGFVHKDGSGRYVLPLNAAVGFSGLSAIPRSSVSQPSPHV